MLGTTLRGRYRIIKELSSGGFGQTYLAEDRDLPGHPQCAVKRLQPQSSDPFVLQTAKRLFNQEAEILHRLGTHEQIPRLMAHFEENQQFYLVQEFIPGNDLSREFAARGKGGVAAPLREAEVIALLRDILDVLAFVHRQGAIHRDIKPANLIRRQSDGKIVLIDFGAVKDIRNLSVNPSGEVTSTVAIGTRGYMPDEQANGKPRFSSDVYAVGVIAIQALTGLNPDPKSGGLAEDPATGEIVWRNRAQVSDALAGLIDQMVRKDCRQRYPTAVEALQAVEGLSRVPVNPAAPSPAPPAGGVPASQSGTEPSKVPSPMKKWKPKHIVNLLGVLAAILAGVMGLFQQQIKDWLDSVLDLSRLTYDAPNSGIKIKYPKTWTKDVKQNAILGTEVRFFSPKEGEGDKFQENLSVEIQDLSAQPVTEQQYTKEALKAIYQFVPNAKILIELKDQNIGNSSGYQVVYTGRDGGQNLKRMQMWAVINNKAYVITYEAEEQKYLQFLPVAQKMVDSFEIK
ncbi:MAG: protein kinase [Oscillatoria princeps RMCB-10]|nr:protein kinase [Oscillatoria princeps RMCB-10]